MIELVCPGSLCCTQTEKFCDAHVLRITTNLPATLLLILIVPVPSSHTASDIPAEQILLHCEFIEAGVDVGVGFEEVDDLLGSDAALEGRLEGLASQTRHHKVRERVLHLHQVLQEGQVNFGTRVSIDFEIRLHDDELVRIRCIFSLTTTLIAFINKHGFIVKKCGFINTHRLPSGIYQELLEETSYIEFYSISLNLFWVQYLNQSHHCEV